MKSKILLRLLAYFTIALLVFSLVVGFVFLRMFSLYITNHYQETMLMQARAIAANAAPVMCGISEETFETGTGAGYRHGSGTQPGQSMRYAAYLNSVQAVVAADIWMVDREAQLLTQGRGKTSFEFGTLPDNAETVIEKVLQGQDAVSENFSDLLGEHTLTVGVPVTAQNGEVVGAILLHSPVSGMTEFQNRGVQILLVSIAFALLLSSLAAAVFALKFTRPLKVMKKNALLISQGQYDAKNNIQQKDEIGELAQAMDTMADRLAAAAEESAQTETQRREFIASISHELRTPVTVMRGSLEALCDGVVSQPEKVADYHRQLLSESIHLQRLVNDLLEISRLQSTGFTLEMEDFSLQDAVHDAVRSMQRLADNKQIELLYRPFAQAWPVHGDYSRVRQMLLAVLDNAVKFSPENTVVLVEEKAAGQSCSVSVTDSGPGIPEQELPHIFERFRHTHGEANKGGTGLGLAIASEIARRHSIGLEVQSRPGETVFTFTFPSCTG